MKVCFRFLLVVLISLVLFTGCSNDDSSDNGNNGQSPIPSVTTPSNSDTLPNDVISALELTLQNIYQKVNPSVVNIQVIQVEDSSLFDIPGFDFDFQIPEDQQEYFSQAYASGFVWDTDGRIVTNNHVVSNAVEIYVTFDDGTVIDAEIVGTDPDSDLAVIEVDMPETSLQPVELADSKQVKVGQLSVSIGNPFGLEGTMTVGFVSALGRLLPVESDDSAEHIYSIPDVIQTDAPINPGNSGGVLVNKNGHVIGVPSAIISPIRASAGIGLAIPSVIVNKVVPDLIENGYYDNPWLGISGLTLTPEIAEAMDLEPEQRGALIIEVLSDSPAEGAGLQGSDRDVVILGERIQIGGDVIIAIDDVPMESIDDVVTYIVRDTEVGQSISLEILRDGDEHDVDLVLIARPSSRTGSSSTGVAWLGIAGITITPEIAEAMDLSSAQTGVLIQQVISESPADDADLRGSYKTVVIDGEEVLIGGDIIVGFNDYTVDAMETLQNLVQAQEPEDEVSLDILRDGESIEITVILGERSE